jgi:hypothetical protein
MLDNQTPDSTDPARWVNYARFFQSLYKGTNNQPLVPEATTHGTITKIETQACYNPAPKL